MKPHTNRRSPSEYIFRTQLENLRSAADGHEPDNIRFFTYAKLMNMTEEELTEIQPDYIVRDDIGIVWKTGSAAVAGKEDRQDTGNRMRLFFTL